MIKKVILLALTTASGQLSYAQEAAPMITGTVNVSIKKGTFTCDLIVDNIPRIKDYYFRLNSGMNLLYIKSLDKNFLINYDKSLKDTTASGEASAYYFPDNTGKGKFLPHKLEMRYTGMFPVATDTIANYSVVDWKGNLAFNGHSLRADGNQSCWYPILYDITKDVALSKVKYDLQINCLDCQQIYLNGNVPVKGPSARLKSSTPLEISMYLGNYKVVKQGDTYFLNPDLTLPQVQEFSRMTATFKKFYEEHLQIPYTTAVTYVQTTPTSKNNSWLFVSYPTIFAIGRGSYGLKRLFDRKTSDWFKPFIAHELGHYYFGTHRVFNSPLGDAFSEGFTEYISLTLTKDLLSDSIYQQKIRSKLNALKNFRAVPFAKVTSEKLYGNRELYVYYYAPLLFTAIQQEIGEQQMWHWLRALLITPTERTDYQYLTNTLKATLANQIQAKELISRYFEDDQALANAIRKIQQP